MTPRERAPDGPGELKHNPFASLRSRLPAGEPARDSQPGPTPAPDVADASAGAAPLAGARLVVRHEKRGRAGKTVTRISGAPLDAPALAELARELKRALGCGASVEGEDLLLQGKLKERAAAWLREHRGADARLGN